MSKISSLGDLHRSLYIPEINGLIEFVYAQVIQKNLAKLKAYLPRKQFLRAVILYLVNSYICSMVKKVVDILAHSSHCWLGVVWTASPSPLLVGQVIGSHKNKQTSEMQVLFCLLWKQQCDATWEKTLLFHVSEYCKPTSETQRKKAWEPGPVILLSLKITKEK